MAVVQTDNLMLPARGFYGLPLLRQLGLMVGLAASVAIGVAVVLWSQTPSYQMLYSNLAEQDSAAVIEALRKAGIKYQIADGTGTILVPESQVHDARLQLAGEGLPRGVGSGFELLDNQKGFGVSQFMENARYQRALEGELSMTIASISSVRSARVHLAIPKQTAFARNQQQPTASITVDLYAGRSLNDGQVAAIGHMVAASIPNLGVDKVTIIDQHGRLLTANESSEDMRLTATQFDHRKRLEQHYIKRIEDLLTPIIGVGSVKAQVNAEMDFTMTEQTQELFAPDRQAVRSEQLIEERMVGGRQGGGVPGSLSNQPPADGVTDQEETGGSSTQRNTRNYELDRTISHTKMNGGVISRLSAAIVVDNRSSVNDDGETVSTPLSEEEIERITALVRQAIGFNAERGDSINVINAPFTALPELEPLPEPSMMDGLDIGSILKQLLAVGVVGFLLFGVLRPVLRELATKGKPAPQSYAEGDEMSEDQLTLSGERPALPKGVTMETNLEAAKMIASQDPKRVAQVVRTWLATN